MWFLFTIINGHTFDVMYDDTIYFTCSISLNIILVWTTEIGRIDVSICLKVSILMVVFTIYCIYPGIFCLYAGMAVVWNHYYSNLGYWIWDGERISIFYFSIIIFLLFYMENVKCSTELSDFEIMNHIWLMLQIGCFTN